MKPITAPQLKAKKQAGEKIVMLTCYDATFASVLEQTDVDCLLVGDSLGMVIQGRSSTLPVTVEDIVYHSRCVARQARQKLLIADLPFMSYQPSVETALVNAGRLLKEGGAQAVKLEGGCAQFETVQTLVRAGIPVMGHIGMEPQSVHQTGGYKIQGKTEEASQKLIQDGLSLEAAGCFAIVLEGMAPETAKKITQTVSIPTIGIASGPDCDGQVLVLYDILGLNPGWQPKFAKKYLDGNRLVFEAAQSFVKEVRQGLYPSEQQEEKEGFRLIQ
ncbi:MAG: 3-methyl-2-oxobutanoate hydroxymethyltransferase [Deltaproteobacteria bacterium]|nr:3-methyl-2-oxobutanoate hydroxymethyltransferase [Deltaproteobacteria bacterium]